MIPRSVAEAEANVLTCTYYAWHLRGRKNLNAKNAQIKF